MRSDPENSKEVFPAPGPAADDKKTMKGLNDRLSGYLGRVRNLEDANKDLEDQIQDILGKRVDPNGRDWDVVEKPLNDLRKKVIFHSVNYLIWLIRLIYSAFLPFKLSMYSTVCLCQLSLFTW